MTKPNNYATDPKFNRTIISVQEAQSRVMSRMKAGGVEFIPLEEAYGRHAAATVRSDVPVPHFCRSMMDGYAVRAADLAYAGLEKPVRLRVTEEVACGTVASRSLRPGEAVRIMTGAQVPEGADAVVKLEETTECGSAGKRELELRQPVTEGDNLLPVGVEIEQGELMVGSGRRIGAGEMALLAMFGCATVQVHRRPRVAILSTGHELLDVSAPLEPGKIRNSNSFMLAAQVREAGGIPHLLPHVPDELERAKSVIMEAMKEFDAVVTTGGVSVGDYDVMYDLTNNWSGELLFNKVAMRPGSPTTVGLLYGKLLFALSGNPSACYVGFEMFVRPALLRMQGAHEPSPHRMTAALMEPFAKQDRFERFVRGNYATDENGNLTVRLAGIDMSNATITIRDADCLICIPPTNGVMPAGTRVDIIPLRLRR